MLLMALLMPWAANAQTQCDITYELTDSYGDGWNGGTLVVTDATTSTQLASLTIESGNSLTGSIPVTNEHEISFAYTPGSWAYENSWVIYDVAGTIIWSGSGSDGSQTFSYIAECPSCFPPTALVATLTPGNGTIATLNWNAGATETAWVLEYGTASDFTGATSTNVSGTPTKDLTGLTAEQTYYARVKAICGGDDESSWSVACEFTPTDAYSLTVNDGTSTNNYVPYYAYYHDASQRSEFIIPASSLSDLAWGTITSMKFYPNYTYTTSASIKVYLMEVEEETFSDVTFYGETDATVVYDGTLSISPNGMTIAFAGNGFLYGGGNLLVGFYQSAGGSGYYSSSTCPFYGVSATGASISQYSSYSGLRNFLPKTTFDYIPGEAPACMWPTGLTVSNVTAHTAELSWTSDGTAWEVEVAGEYTSTWNANAIPFTLQGLEPETEYTVRVRTVCDTDVYSDWSAPVSFTTDVACPAPTDLVISDITAYSANVAWTSDNTNIEFRYAPDLNPNNDFENGLSNWTTIDADGDGYTWYALVNQGILGNDNSLGLATSASYNGSALTPDNYLVSPQITLGNSISFWACAQDASWAAEHFGVAVSTTGNTDAADFTTIAEWTIGSRSANVLRSSNTPRGGNRDQSEWVQYTVDLSAYSGQGYVAIRHFDCTDMFRLNVDDIVVDPDYMTTWVNVADPTNPQALTNLEPETTYVVQVRANCGDEGYSAWLEGTFTTLPACMVPTNLVISNIDKRSADLAWTPNGEEEAWQICLNGDETNLINVTDTSYSFTGLTPETLYNVKVRAYCDEELQSAWSTPAIFTTLVACPAPTALAVSDITNVSAVATWTYDGDVELEYAEDVWRHYDNGVYPGGGGIGTGGSDVYWAIMLPPTMLPTEPLTKVSLFEATGYSEEPITLMIYSGGDTAPGTLLYQEEVTPLAADDFHEITLAEPVTFDATQNLWIVCKEYGTYPAIGCNNVDEPNGRWISLDGTEWEDVMNYSLDYTWMIRAAFGNNNQTEWVAVNNPASPQTIAGLMPETNYMVRVRAVCGGEDGESVWVNTSFTTDVACPAPTALGATPYALSAELSWEGTSESYIVRYGYDEVAETIYSQDFAEGIPTDWTNDTINPWTVVDGYIQSGNAGVSSSTSTISFTMTVGTDANFEFDAECMGEGTSSYWDHCDFYIDGTRVFYHGAELGSGWNHYSFPITAGSHTFTWSYTKDSSVDPTGDYFAIDNIAINMVNRVWETTTANTNECTITGLSPLTTYYVQVMGDCGDFGTSEWSEIISFTTSEDACPVPTNLAVDAESITATTAGLSWEGSLDVENFTVRYRTPEHVVGGMSESFNSTGVPAGWTRYSGLVNDVIAGTATLTTTTSGWYTTEYALGTYNMKVNIYGTSAKYWLVTPEVTLTSGNLSFDLALTDFNNADPIEDATAQADDRFVVLVYANEAWTILREWNNSGSDYVYNNIATEGEAVSIDLSAYVGQAVKIAFYGESTVTSNGDNDLHIDNVVIGNPQTIPATDWQTVTTDEMNVTLEGLTPETLYEAQVKSTCSDPEAWSNTVTFTTLEQTTVTQTIALSAGWNWVSTGLEITMSDLQNAIIAVVPSTDRPVIKSQRNGQARWTGSRWTGLSTLDLSQMYKIKVGEACEIVLEGMPINPADHPATIQPGPNWIAFPLLESMTIGNAFSNYTPVNGDVVKGLGTGQKRWNGTMWTAGTLNQLTPGKGYIYNSKATGNNTLVFPMPAK